MKSKILDLDKKTDTLMLGNQKLSYVPNEKHKVIFFSELGKLNPKKDNSEHLLSVFQKILGEQNKDLKLEPGDIFGLLNYFLSIYL